jgi:integral membrane protein (TIGR01906 family)
MNKLANATLGFLLGLMILTTVLFTSIEIIAFNLTYYQWHYQHYNIMADTDIELEHLTLITKEMLSFLRGTRRDLDMEVPIAGEMKEVFGEREKMHMDDVQELFKIGTLLRNVSFFLAIAMIFLIWRLAKPWMDKLLIWVQYVMLGFITLMLVLGVIISTNFNHYFNIFHEIFFSNDLWLLDPNTEVLINLVPLSFFINTSGIIVLIFLVLSTLIVLGARYLRKIIRT